MLRISHASLTPALRARERALVQQHPDIDLEVIAAERWHEGGMEVEACADDLIKVTPVRTRLIRRVPLFAYDPQPLVRALRRHCPHLIDLHQESYSVACAQVLMICRHYAPHAPIVLAATQNILRRYPPPFEAMEQRAFKAVAAAYPCSRTVLEVLRAKGFTKPAPVIPFGVDLGAFRARTPACASDKPLTIGFVGRMLPAKGLSVLVKALVQIATEPWKLLLVGDGPERHSVERQLAAHNLLSRAHFAGAVPYHEVARYYEAMDVLVVPTQTTARVREQFGRVLVEAMASRVCVIGSTSGAIPEVIGEAGLIIPESDSTALATALRQVLSDVGLRERLAHAGRARVERHYTWQRAAEQMYALYRQVLNTQN